MRCSYAPRALALSAALVALAPVGARADGFDAIFYRARAGFHFCYALVNRVGWSERPIASAISHAARTACPSKSPPLTSDQLTASNDCTHGCSSDCASYVFKAWHINTSASLVSIDAPDECANASGKSGLDKIVKNDANRVRDAANLEPGDDCENTGHASLLVRSRSDGSWNTWEARSSAGGLGSATRTPPSFVTENDGRTPCGPATNNGCWRPTRARTGAPTPSQPPDGSTVNDPNDFYFQFAAPNNLPALADYLLWIYWDENEGQTNKQPSIQHRLIRLPAFTHRFDDEPIRLARLPNATEACGTTQGYTCPVDTGDGASISLKVQTLMNAQTVTPLNFKVPNGGSVSAAWDSTQVPCVDTSPPTYPGQSACGDGGFQQATAIQFVPGRTYHWAVRVERYGEERAGHFARAQAVGACSLTQSGFEAEQDCLDPSWSPIQSFKVASGQRCHVQMMPNAAASQSVTCPMTAELWVIDPASIQGCITFDPTACNAQRSQSWDFDFYIDQKDMNGNDLGAGTCSAAGSGTGCGPQVSDLMTSCQGMRSCGMDSSGNTVYCSLCNCANHQGPWMGPGSMIFSNDIPTMFACDGMGDGGSFSGTMAFDFVSCADPSVSSYPFCHP